MVVVGRLRLLNYGGVRFWWMFGPVCSTIGASKRITTCGQFWSMVFFQSNHERGEKFLISSFIYDLSWFRKRSGLDERRLERSKVVWQSGNRAKREFFKNQFLIWKFDLKKAISSTEKKVRRNLRCDRPDHPTGCCPNSVAIWILVLEKARLKFDLNLQFEIYSIVYSLHSVYHTLFSVQ